MPTTDVTIVTVTYNSAAVLPQMLGSIPAGIPVIIVDNGSADFSAIASLANEHGASLLRNDVNEGFGRACNRGAAAAKTRFLLFLNPDAQLCQGALEAFLASSENHASASGFNPSLFDQHGALRLRRRSKVRPDLPRLEGDPTSDIEIPTLHGSAIFLARETFNAIGGFDPAIFLYHEDDDLALRLQAHGPLMLCHEARVVHLEGRSTERIPRVAYFKAYQLARSRIYVHGKHGQHYIFLKTLAQALAGLFSPLNIIPRKAAKSMGFLAGTLSSLSDKGRFLSE